MSTPDLERLATAVEHRRIARFPSRKAAATAAGISKDTWARVEEGRAVRGVSYARMEAALGWAPGSCKAVLAGGDPVEIKAVEGAPGYVTATLRPEDRTDRALESVQLSVIGVADTMPGDEIRKLSERIVEDLRARGII